MLRPLHFSVRLSNVAEELDFLNASSLVLNFKYMRNLMTLPKLQCSHNLLRSSYSFYSSDLVRFGPLPYSALPCRPTFCLSSHSLFYILTLAYSPCIFFFFWESSLMVYYWQGHYWNSEHNAFGMRKEHRTSSSDLRSLMKVNKSIRRPGLEVSSMNLWRSWEFSLFCLSHYELKLRSKILVSEPFNSSKCVFFLRTW